MNGITIPIKNNDKFSDIYICPESEAPKLLQGERSRLFQIAGDETPEEDACFLHNVVMFKFENKKSFLTLEENSYYKDVFFSESENTPGLYVAYDSDDYIDTYFYRRFADGWREILENNPDIKTFQKLVHDKKDQKLKLCNWRFYQKEFKQYNLTQEYPASENHPLVKYVNELYKQNDMKFQKKCRYSYKVCSREEYLKDLFSNYLRNGHYKEVEQILSKNYFSKEVEEIIEQSVNARRNKYRMYKDDSYLYRHTNLQGKLKEMSFYERTEGEIGFATTAIVKTVAINQFKKFKELISKLVRETPHHRIINIVDAKNPQFVPLEISRVAIAEDKWTWAVTKEFTISWEGKEKTLKPGDQISISSREFGDWVITEIDEDYYNKEELKHGKLVWDPAGYHQLPVLSLEGHDWDFNKNSKATKDLFMEEIAKVITDEPLLNKEEMKTVLEQRMNKLLVFGYNPFLKDRFDALIQNSVNTWWDEGYRDELLEAAKHRLEKDVVFSEYFEKYLTQVNIESAAIHTNEFERICDELKEKFYIDRLKNEFKDIVPEAKDIEIYIENEKSIDTEYDFSKVVDAYIKETKNYQAAEMVSVWDKEMIKDYSDFLINKIKNDDRNVDKYYDKMLEIEKKHDLPAEFKQELEKVKDVYEDNIEDKDRKR